MSPKLRFAANLSFLFAELPFKARFAAAAAADFEAVEFHFPYAEDKEVLAEAALIADVQTVLFNLPAGQWEAGERGIACLPDRVEEFRQGVETAIAYAMALDVKQLNCLAGNTPTGADNPKIRATLLSNLRFAADRLAAHGIGLLLEPLNSFDNPGFMVNTTRAGLELLDHVNHPNIRLQYDVYHAQRMEGELANTLSAHLQRIGHIQIADNPGRHEPGTGEINYRFLFQHLRQLGYQGWIGCEYRPSTTASDSLTWRKTLLADT
jgi:hydroxypyruvate isomerase